MGERDERRQGKGEAVSDCCKIHSFFSSYFLRCAARFSAEGWLPCFVLFFLDFGARCVLVGARSE